MALFRDLVSAIAQSEGLDQMTVTGIGQYLRDAGMISKHGRGRSGAQMTARDATNLLIAVNASPVAKHAVQTVRAFRSLQLVVDDAAPSAHAEWDAIYDSDEGVIPLRRGTRLEVSLEALLSAYIRSPGTNPDPFHGWSEVSVTFKRPRFECEIRISDPSDEDQRAEALTLAGFRDPEEGDLAAYPDKLDATTVTRRTLLALGRTLAV